MTNTLQLSEIKERLDLSSRANPLEEVKHHGIKGMKWGVRKSRSARRSGSKAEKKEGKKSSASKPKKQMSTAELQDAVNRIKLEKEYARLTAREVSPGQKFIKEVLSSAGKQVAIKYTQKYMDDAAGKLIANMTKKK